MANMYVRVPHYVAAFYRNRDEFKPIEVGQPVDVENVTMVWNMLMGNLLQNPKEKVIKEGCFCERMWRKMMRGQYIVQQKGCVRMSRDSKAYLTDTEVRELCGLKVSGRSETYEYLCIKLPPYILHSGRQVAIDGQWQLMYQSCKLFIGYLRNYFWECCLRYVEEFIKAGEHNGVKHSQAEGFERFLARYDIRSGENEKDQKSLKRAYFRRVQQQPDKKYDFVDFGDAE